MLKDLLTRVIEARPTNISKLILSFGKANEVEKIFDIWSIADGMVALFRGKDGNAYEVQVRPVRYAQYKQLFGKLLKKD